MLEFLYNLFAEYSGEIDNCVPDEMFCLAVEPTLPEFSTYDTTLVLWDFISDGTMLDKPDPEALAFFMNSDY